MCIVISIVNDMAELNNWINYKRDILSSFGSVPMYRWGGGGWWGARLFCLNSDIEH